MNDGVISNLIAGLQIIAKYDNNNVCAEHDVIYAGHSCWEDMSEEDCNAMETNGWHWDDDVQCYALFV